MGAFHYESPRLMQTAPAPIAVDERVCAPAIGKSVAWLRKDRLSTKIIPFYRIGKSIRYDLDRVRAALATTEEGGPKRTAKRAS